jgi:hypothetical protein
MIWENNAKVIVMLTGYVEGNRVIYLTLHLMMISSMFFED